MNTLILDILCKQLGDMYKLLGVCGPLGSYVENVCQLDVCISIVYIMPTIGECLSVGDILILDIFCQQSGGYIEVDGCLWALRALGGECLSVGYMY